MPQYRILKKAIGKAEAEIDAVEVAQQEERDGQVRTRSPIQIEAPAADPSSRANRDLERGMEADGEADDESVRGKTSNPPPMSPLDSQISRRSSNYSRTSRIVPGETDTQGTDAPLFKISARPAPPLHRGQRSILDTLTLPKRRRETLVEFDINSLGPQCRRFFTLLDRELDKVSTFYGDREEGAVKRFEELSSQWKELADHKQAFKAFRTREMATPTLLAPFVARVPASFQLPGSGLVRRTLAQRTPRSEELPSTTSGSSLPSKPLEPAFTHKPEDYGSAKSKLKLATFEYYRSLGMLKSYRVLNRTGFTKALKKFEKSTKIQGAAKWYSKKLDSANFVSSPKLDELIRETEDAFASVFEHGDRKKALERLRLLGDEKAHHFTAWRSGLYIGIGFVLLLEGIVKSAHASKHVEIPQWVALLQLFAAMFLPVLFTLLFYLNLVAWHHARINYVLIFELDLRTRMNFRQFIEIPALLFLIFSVCFWAAFSNFWPNQIAPTAYPMVFLVVAMFVLLCPMPFLYPSARWWMSRVITSGLVRVEFRDFFIGDELNSLSYAVYNLGFLYCTYSKGWPTNVSSVCSTNQTWTSPVLASLPAVWRLGQSLRRYIDSDGVGIHLLNAGKYSTTIAYFFFYFSWRMYGSGGGWRMALWILFGVINASYSASWDLIMDWSLGRRNSKHLLLRAELAFKDTVYLYYVAVVLDILLRFSWVIYLAPAPSVELRGFIVALLEVLRRIMWNAIRVESEHIGNVDGYRVTRDVPLPYVMPGTTTIDSTDITDDVEEGSTKKQKVFSFFHKLHASVVADLEPLTSIHLPSLSYGTRKPSRTKRQKKDYERRRSGAAAESSSPASEEDGEPDTASDVEGGEEDDELREDLEDAEAIREISVAEENAEVEKTRRR